VAKWTKAPVSKTGDSRFESWLPRFHLAIAARRRGNEPPVGIAAYVLFFLAGVGFGYAAPGKWRWVPIVFPLALAVGAAAREGVDGTMAVRLIVALLVTAGGVFLGALLDARGERGERARYA
jgi:hypothetical protein